MYTPAALSPLGNLTGTNKWSRWAIFTRPESCTGGTTAVLDFLEQAAKDNPNEAIQENTSVIFFILYGSWL
jgi:hypothetical protein